MGRRRWRGHPGSASRRGGGTPAAAANYRRRASACPTSTVVLAANIITNVVVRRVTALVSGRVRLRSSVDTLVNGTGAAMNRSLRLAACAIIAAALLVPTLAHTRGGGGGGGHGHASSYCTSCARDIHEVIPPPKTHKSARKGRGN